ncbi:uncharacterized protein N7529_006153 [Penicillium soppii]|uniref:uncharacterized protein n=1 Tax=Penicillium soppii TaxID=69789 RepID=UPI002547FFD0|nr:uncharacterized protein N7529_006153 [Penicillium soppii]KAJ5864237.1 hypothetical protein N7529_006153 [Penicillium soppii]
MDSSDSNIPEDIAYHQRWDFMCPKLTHAQWEICESYGGWTQFLDHYGLKRPWERVQWVEGVKILDIIARRIDAACPESPL